MTDADNERRPKRRCVQRKNAVPSAVHYVGYVEDEETPEMIMKKFEEMERVVSAARGKPGPSRDDGKENVDVGNTIGDTTEKKTGSDEQTKGEPSVACVASCEDVAGPSGSHGDALDENLLLEVFKNTSCFNVKSVMQNNDVLLAGDHNPDPLNRGAEGTGDWFESDDSDADDMEYLRGFWSDGDVAADVPRRGRRAAGSSAPKPRSARPQGSARERHMRHQVVTQYNKDTNALIRRKVKAVQRDEILQLRVPPPPLPLSWGRTVRPYEPRKQPLPQQPSEQQQVVACSETTNSLASTETRAAVGADEASGSAATSAQYIESADVVAQGISMLPRQAYQAVMINTGWEVTGDGQDERALINRLSQVPLPKLCPVGFIFAWAHKEHIHAITKLLYNWGYQYVENLTWVWMHPSNAILREKHAYARKSHLTLLIFRKEGEGKDIELKHQRSPDVVFDCLRWAPSREWEVPPEVYTTIETMLPTGLGMFLELWAARHVRRPGWTHLVELGGQAGSRGQQQAAAQC